MNIKEKWVSWEEFNLLLPGLSPTADIDFNQVSGLTPGAIPFGDATGMLTESADLFWDEAEKNLGIGTNTFGATMTQGIQIATGLAPTANVADTFAFYSADFAAGNACPHFRTENGTVIGLNQSLFTTDNVIFAALTVNNTGLHILDTGGDHYLTIKPNEDLSVSRILSIVTGDAARTITLSGNPTLADWFDQGLKQASFPSFAGLYIKNSGELRFYDNGNYVGFEAPALIGNTIWILPDADGAAGEAIVTDGARNLSWAAAGAADEKVKIDAAATAGYLGAAGNDGVLRVDATLTYTDGGNFVTLGVDPSAIKLDDLGAPDDNTDLDFSTLKHGLVPKGTNVGHFLKDDGTWAAGGGGGAVVFPDLTDTPANYVGAADKIVKVNAVPDALVFGADIEDLEDVDTLTGQAGKYGKVKVGDAGIEWVAGVGTAGPVLIFDSKFDDLALGDIDGKGAYDFWGTWVNGSGAGCTAEIVADPGNGRMLRLDDQSAVNACKATLTMTPNLSAEVLVGVVEWKVRVSVLAANSRGYFRFLDKDIAATGQGGFFRGDSNDIWYRSSGNNTGQLVVAVVDTWYIVRTFFDRLGNYAVWWVDGAFEQNRITMDAGDKFDFLELETRDIHSGCVYDIKYVKVWSLHYAA